MQLHGHLFGIIWPTSSGCHKVPEHVSGACRKLATSVGREGRKEGKKIEEREKKWETVAQRQEMIIGTLALLRGCFMVTF